MAFVSSPKVYILSIFHQQLDFLSFLPKMFSGQSIFYSSPFLIATSQWFVTECLWVRDSPRDHFSQCCQLVVPPFTTSLTWSKCLYNCARAFCGTNDVLLRSVSIASCFQFVSTDLINNLPVPSGLPLLSHSFYIISPQTPSFKVTASSPAHTHTHTEIHMPWAKPTYYLQCFSKCDLQTIHNRIFMGWEDLLKTHIPANPQGNWIRIHRGGI